MASKKEFWKYKQLDDMTHSEWESLCDGCGQCCQIKLEDSATGKLIHTNVACHLLALETCKCSDYTNRRQKVPDCVVLKPEELKNNDWLPATCAYLRLSKGQPLPKWHYLRSGKSDSVHLAKISIKSKAVHETDVVDIAKHFITS